MPHARLPGMGPVSFITVSLRLVATSDMGNYNSSAEDLDVESPFYQYQEFGNLQPEFNGLKRDSINVDANNFVQILLERHVDFLDSLGGEEGYKRVAEVQQGGGWAAREVGT
ncbi:hypothetical protein EDD11_004470 [Mortierella claussenii]|nr:hypothetical protein EDD11_004470 [Mortierella claussenii]